MISFFPPSTFINPPFPPTPQSRSNMFNRLPPELVRQIIESTVPSTYHSKTYGDRQATLRSLCLACRLFRDIAQPILCQVVVIPNDGNSHAHSVIDQFTEPPRQVVVMVPTWDQLLDLAISNGSRIRDLTIDVGLGRSDAPLPIQHFMELRTLRLYSEAALSNSLSLPHLKGLTIGGKRQVYLFTRFLTRSNFPSLRALAFTHANSDCLRSILGHSPALSLILSLDAFFINNLRDPETMIVPLESVLSSTLVTCSRIEDALQWESTASKSRHLRLSGISDESAFRKLATNIESSTRSPLTSLYLDESCSPNFARAGQEVERSELRRLVAACEARGVEVVYEEGPANWVLDPVISPEFWRRQREFGRDEAVSP